MRVFTVSYKTDCEKTLFWATRRRRRRLNHYYYYYYYYFHSLSSSYTYQDVAWSLLEVACWTCCQCPAASPCWYGWQGVPWGPREHQLILTTSHLLCYTCSCQSLYLPTLLKSFPTLIVLCCLLCLLCHLLCRLLCHLPCRLLCRLLCRLPCPLLWHLLCPQTPHTLNSFYFNTQLFCYLGVKK